MDDLKNEFRMMKQSIEKSMVDNPNQIYQRFLESQKSKKEPNLFRNVFLWKRIAMIVLLVNIIIGIGVFAKYRNMKGNLTTKVVFGDTSGNSDIHQDARRVTSLSKIKQLFDNADNFKPNPPTTNPPTTGNPALDPTYSALNPDYSVDMSSHYLDTNRTYMTNTQEEGIDEADIVKVNGDYIYYIKNRTLYILKTEAGKMEIVKKYGNYQMNYTKNLYYTDKYLIVIASPRKNSRVYEIKQYIRIFIYDIHTYEQVVSVEVPGSNISTRLINNELYVVNSDYNYDENHLPICYVDDVAHETSINNIYYSPDYGLDIDSYTSIFRFTLDDIIQIDDFYLLSPYIKDIYVTSNAIYLLRNKKDNESIQSETKRTKYPISNVLVIDISENIRVNGLIKVNGIIGDKYWIDEYNGYVRIATTYQKSTYRLTNDYWTFEHRDICNQLSVFQQNEEGMWKEIGSVSKGLGEVGESIRSVRFNKEFVTIVTYRDTDPLYYINLSNPTQPVITSELKISGYSVYQHPYQDDYVIGIGYESEGSRIDGYKIALFDISDPSHIVQVGNPYIFDLPNNVTLAVLFDPKTLFLNLENDIFGLATKNNMLLTAPDYTIWIGGEPVTIRNPNKLNDYYYVFKIDVMSENPIQVVLEETSKEHTFERMVFIGNYYYLLASDVVYSYQVINGQFLPYDALQLI